MAGELALLHKTACAVSSDIPDDEVDAGWSAAGWNALRAAGLTGIGVPEALGGAGGGLTEAAVVLHAAGLTAAPVPIAEASLLAGPLLAAADIAVPDGVLTFARGGRATPHGTRWQLTASLTRTPWGRFADHVAVLAEADSGFVAALVPVADCAVYPGRNLAGEPRDRVEAADIAVDAAPVAARLADDLDLRAAAARVVMMAGAAEAAMHMTIRYAQERVQFGRPIAKFQAVQQAIAQLAGETAVLGAAAQACVDALTGPPHAWPQVAAAKVRAGTAAGTVSRIAHQVHGALGFTQEHRLRVFTQRLLAWRDESGTEREWAARLGSWVLRTGPAALAAVLADQPAEGG